MVDWLNTSGAGIITVNKLLVSNCKEIIVLRVEDDLM